MTKETTKDALAILEKEIGPNSEIYGFDKFIDTGYAPLNKIISNKYKDGGLPYGRIIEIVGESSSGKTLLATKFMIEVQKLGGVAIFIDWERSFSIKLAQDLGLNIERPYFFYFTPDTWEAGNMIATKICAIIREKKIIDESAPIISIFDSVASAVPAQSISKEIDAYGMNDTTALARVASTTLKVMNQRAWKTNATFVYLNQVRTVPGAYVPTTSTPGGKAMEYQSSVRLFVSKKKLVDKEKKYCGQRIMIEARKNKMTKPFQTCCIDMYYNDENVPEFDYVSSIIDELIAQDKLETSGAWIVFDGKKYYKSQLVQKVNEEGLYQKLCDILENDKQEA